jgi:hypothetical protein
MSVEDEQGMEEQPQNEIDTSRWTGAGDRRKVPHPGFGVGEAAAFFGILVLLGSAKAAIFDGLWWLDAVVMIAIGLAFILFGLRRRSAR